MAAQEAGPVFGFTKLHDFAGKQCAPVVGFVGFEDAVEDVRQHSQVICARIFVGVGPQVDGVIPAWGEVPHIRRREGGRFHGLGHGDEVVVGRIIQRGREVARRGRVFNVSDFGNEMGQMLSHMSLSEIRL